MGVAVGIGVGVAVGGGVGVTTTTTVTTAGIAGGGDGVATAWRAGAAVGMGVGALAGAAAGGAGFAEAGSAVGAGGAGAAATGGAGVTRLRGDIGGGRKLASAVCVFTIAGGSSFKRSSSRASFAPAQPCARAAAKHKTSAAMYRCLCFKTDACAISIYLSKRAPSRAASECRCNIIYNSARPTCKANQNSAYPPRMLAANCARLLQRHSRAARRCLTGY